MLSLRIPSLAFKTKGKTGMRLSVSNYENPFEISTVNNPFHSPRNSPFRKFEFNRHAHAPTK